MNKQVKQALRPLVQHALSPRAVQSLRFYGWYASSYLPRRLNPRTRRPIVQEYGPTTTLAAQLRAINLEAPTELCKVMTHYGSDKAWHGYTPIYSALFQERYDRPVRILELGLGSNNPDVLSNMGIFGAPGASLHGWHHMFQHAQIVGADIDRGILFQDDRIQTFHCDQLDADSIAALWAQPALCNGADLIIEDGLHTFEANLSFLNGSLRHLRPGGIYVVEDIEWEALGKWTLRLPAIASEYPAYEFAVVNMAEQAYNNMLIAHRVA